MESDGVKTETLTVPSVIVTVTSGAESPSTSTTTSPPPPPRPKTLYPVLTTLWTKPTTGCSVTVSGQLPSTFTVPGGIKARHDWDMDWQDYAKLSCFPPNFAITQYNPEARGFFSPGLCPQGHTMVSAAEDEKNDPGITTAACCSYGFTLNAEECRSSVPTPTYLAYMINRTSSMSTGMATYDGIAVVWPAIRIMYRKDDPVLVAANASWWSVPPTGSSTSAAAPSSKPELAPATGIPTADSTQPSSTLTTAAKAGIGVGVTIFVLLCLFGFWFWRRRRRQLGGNTATAGTPPEANPFDKSELPTNEAGNIPRELDAEGRVVAWSDGAKYYVPPVELPVTYGGYVSTSRGDLTEMGGGHHSIQDGGCSPHISELGSGTIGPDRSRTVSGVESDRTVTHGRLTPSSPPLPSPLSNPSSPPLHHSPSSVQ